MTKTDLEDLTIEELEVLLQDMRRVTKGRKRKRRKMKTGKKALLAYFIICGGLVSFTMAMIYSGIESSALNILAEAGIKGLPAVYGIYQANSFFINKKHMEENYIKDYDEENLMY